MTTDLKALRQSAEKILGLREKADELCASNINRMSFDLLNDRNKALTEIEQSWPEACDTLAAMVPLIDELEAANEALLWMADEKNWIEPDDQALIKRADGTGGKQFGIILVSAGLKPWVFAAQHAAMKHTEPDGEKGGV